MELNANGKLYLDLLKNVVLNLNRMKEGEDQDTRLNGRDWNPFGETMIGIYRLNNIQHCMVDAISRGIEGDFIETGCWKGGATILMRAILKALDVNDRIVWVADSFEGLPKPDVEKYPKEDKNDPHHTFKELAIPLEEVTYNFKKYGLLDDKVKFLKGWFKDTLHVAPIEKLCVLRLDGDMYASTWDAITVLYPKLSVGGYIIVDDYNCIKGCVDAIDDYRAQNNITTPMIPTGGNGGGIYWMKES